MCNCPSVWSSLKLCLGLSFTKLYFVSKDGEPGAEEVQLILLGHWYVFVCKVLGSTKLALSVLLRVRTLPHFCIYHIHAVAEEVCIRVYRRLASEYLYYCLYLCNKLP